MQKNQYFERAATHEQGRAIANGLLELFNKINEKEATPVKAVFYLDPGDETAESLDEITIDLSADNAKDVCEFVQLLVERQMLAVHTMEDQSEQPAAPLTTDQSIVDPALALVETPADPVEDLPNPAA